MEKSDYRKLNRLHFSSVKLRKTAREWLMEREIVGGGEAKQNYCKCRTG